MAHTTLVRTLACAAALLLCARGQAACETSRVGGLDLGSATAAELRSALDAGKVTSPQLVRGYLARIAECDPRLHAVIATNPAAAAEAAQLQRERAAGKLRGPLHGIPVLLKDNIDVAGLPTTAGSLALAANLRDADAPLVARLRAAGLIVIAKGNLSEWANFRSRQSSSGWSAVGGLTVNAAAPQRTACGSSSGSAVAVAARLAPLAVGTETNGSIVCPASMNGVVGLKPTVGLIPQDGIVPISHSQDTAGPMTATVADAAALLGALTGREYAVGPDALRGARLGVARFLRGYSPRTESLFNDALARLKARGAELVDIEQFDPAPVRDAQLPILLTEFKAGINAYLATTPPAVKTRTLADLIAFNRATPRELEWFGQDLFELSEATPGLGDPAYVETRERAQRLAGAEGITRLLREHRVVALIAPTAGPAWMIDLVNGDRGGAGASLLPAVSGFPHLTVPMGRAAGLPVGLSFMAGAGDEGLLLALGAAFED